MSPFSNYYVVTDSMADLPPDCPNVPFAPVRIIVDGQEYLSKMNIDTDSVLEALRGAKHVTTAGANTAGYIKAIEACPTDAPVLVVTMSSKLSGSYNAARAAARVLRNKRDVYVFDSKAGSIAEGLIVKEAIRLSDKADVETALRELEEIRERTRLFMTVRALDHLARSGRISWAKALVGKLFRVYPIITLKEGELVLYKKVKGIESALSFMKNAVEDRAFVVGCVSNCSSVKAAFPGKKIVKVAPGVAVHVGPGAFGVSYIE